MKLKLELEIEDKELRELILESQQKDVDADNDYRATLAGMFAQLLPLVQEMVKPEPRPVPHFRPNPSANYASTNEAAKNCPQCGGPLCSMDYEFTSACMWCRIEVPVVHRPPASTPEYFRGPVPGATYVREGDGVEQPDNPLTEL